MLSLNHSNWGSSILFASVFPCQTWVFLFLLKNQRTWEIWSSVCLVACSGFQSSGNIYLPEQNYRVLEIWNQSQYLFFNFPDFFLWIGKEIRVFFWFFIRNSRTFFISRFKSNISLLHTSAIYFSDILYWIFLSYHKKILWGIGWNFKNIILQYYSWTWIEGRINIIIKIILFLL